MNRAVAAGVVVTAALLVGVACAQAETAYLRRTAPSDSDTVIGIGTRWNKACQSVGVPEVILEEAPLHGTVCQRRGMVRAKRLLAGGSSHCLRQPMPGVQIVYRSNAGFTGPDTLRYTLKFPRFGHLHRVEIDVRPLAAGPGGYAMPPSPRQQPGPMPICAALTS